MGLLGWLSISGICILATRPQASIHPSESAEAGSRVVRVQYAPEGPVSTFRRTPKSRVAAFLGSLPAFIIRDNLRAAGMSREQYVELLDPYR